MRTDTAVIRHLPLGRDALAPAIAARRALPPLGVSRGRVWLNGREVGGRDERYAHLARIHD
jgi:hypothetical protein